MSGSELLNVDNLTLSIRTTAGTEHRLVENISFTLREKRITGLIGESGCGKSLTCLAIMGLLPGAIRQTGGEIRFQGQSLAHLPASHKRSVRGKKLAMILQNPMSCFDAVFTIRHHFQETIASHEKLTDNPIQRIRDALAEVGFDKPDEILNLYPFQMSGGMLQRVMVAIALLMRVPLLIADEPTTDLDVVSQSNILNLLKKICDSHGMTILLVTHDLGVIARLAHDVAVMRQGKIVDYGSVGDLFQKDRHPYTRALTEAHFSLYDQRLKQFAPADKAASSMELLDLKGVCKSYRRGGIFNAENKFDVLTDIHIHIAPGTCLGLLGRSGSGKSTLGRLALGLERPDAGAVFYRGKSVWDMPKKEYREFRRNIQVVFQNSPGSVNPRFTAAQIIAEPLRNFEPGDFRRKIAGLLEQVGLRPEDGAKYPHQFSGGELQRVCIARAIALNPRLIILDEAVSSLDMLIQARIIELLRTLQRSLGTAYLFISHDIRVLVKMADRLAVLNNGHIVEELSLSDSLSRPYHPAFAELIQAILPPEPENK